MGDANLIKDKIRGELEKGLPSKRKILSYLLELLKKDKYPSLSDFDFYDIVGYTYELNLNYKLNLELLFYPIYDALEKKFKKLYGKEKRLEMEQYLIKNFGLFSDLIKEEFEQVDPLKISAFLSDLLSKKEYQLLSESEFIDIVGEAFKSNPEVYMENLYEEVRKRVKKLYGDEKLKEMEKNLLEKFTLYDGEQILFELEGSIKQIEGVEVTSSGQVSAKEYLGYVVPIFGDNNPVKVSISSGSIVVTNYRLIAQGKLKVSGGGYQGISVLSAISGTKASLRDESRKFKIASSIQQELPCYGYQFSIQNHHNLKKMYSAVNVANGISYALLLNHPFGDVIKINLPSGTSQAKVEEQVNTLFKILCKNANQVLNIIEEKFEILMEPKRKQAELLEILRHLRTKEEYQDISDSEYLDIVRETYRLNPQFFKDFLYPKMKSWDFPSFINVKEEFLKIIENLNKETG